MADVKRLRVTDIEKFRLDDRVEKMYNVEGKTATKISEILKQEGFDIDVKSVRYHINTRIKPGLQKKREKRAEAQTALNDEPPEMKLLEASKQAFDKFEECKRIKGKEKEASDWFAHYTDLLEKHLRATGVYERAKNEARLEDDKRIEIFWVIKHECPKCRATYDEVMKDDVTNLSNMQIEDEKEAVISEMSGEKDVRAEKD